MKRIFALLILAAGTLAAQQTGRWVEMLTTREDVIYLDGNTLHYRALPTGDFDATAWFKWVSRDGTGYSLESAEFNGETRQWRLLKKIEYNPQGGVKRNVDQPTPWQDLIPDSVGERLFTMVVIDFPAYVRAHPDEARSNTHM